MRPVNLARRVQAGSPCRTCSIRRARSDPSNAGRRVTSSYSVAPRAYKSLYGGRTSRRTVFCRHVPQRADNVAGARQLIAALGLGQAEVGDPDLALSVQQQVGGLDVAVEDALLVGILQSLRHLDADPRHAAKILRLGLVGQLRSRARWRRVRVRRGRSRLTAVFRLRGTGGRRSPFSRLCLIGGKAATSKSTRQDDR